MYSEAIYTFIMKFIPVICGLVFLWQLPSQQECNCSLEVASCTYEGISFSLFPAHPLFLLRWQARLLSLIAGKPILLQFHWKLLSPRQPCHAVHFLTKESRTQFTHCQCQDKSFKSLLAYNLILFLRNMLNFFGYYKILTSYFLVTCSCETVHSCSVAT